MRVSSKIPANFRGRMLIDYLSSRFTYFSKDQWLNRCREGCVFLNEQAAISPEVPLKINDILGYEMAPIVEPPADLNYRIVYEDDWILAVDKPGNLLVHKSGKSFTNNLIYQLRYCHSPAPFKTIDAINRLDRETSGIVLLSKEKQTLRAMNNALAHRTIHKEYLAVVHGKPSESTIIVSTPIGKALDSIIPNKYCVDFIDGKEAITHVELVRGVGKNSSLLTIKPLTGRTHQIRVHLSSIGLPIVGDLLYGGSEQDYLNWRNDPKFTNSRRIFKRHALHCNVVEFSHPATNQTIHIEALIPADMLELINLLENQ